MVYRESRRFKLAILSFLGQFSIAMANFALVYLLRAKGFDSFEIGIAASINPLFYLISCFAFQIILKERKAKIETIASMLGMAISLFFVMVFQSKAMIYTMLCLYGCANSLLWSNVESWITGKEEGPSLGSSVALFNFSWSLGAGISTFVGGLLSAVSVDLPIIVVVAIFAALAFFIVFIENPDSNGGPESSIEKDSSTNLRFYCWTAVVLLYIGYSLIVTIFPLYALDKLALSEEKTGFLLLSRGLSACISFVILGRFSFWQFNKAFIFSMQLALIFLVALLAIVHSNVAIAFVLVLFGFVFASIYELSIFHGASGAIDRNKRMIVHEVLLTLGTMIGSLLGGYLYKYFSFQMIIVALALPSLAIWIVEIALFVRSTKLNNGILEV